MITSVYFARDVPSAAIMVPFKAWYVLRYLHSLQLQRENFLPETKPKLQAFWLRCSRGHNLRGQGLKKKSEAKAKDRLFEDSYSRGQGQKWSRPRPRTKDTIFLNFGRQIFC